MKRKRLCTLLLCAALSLSGAGAAAESSYEALCAQRGLQSPDLIAWLEIPGEPYCEPVMRHPDDDGYYASHAPDGQASGIGSVYVQAKYNAADFSDPVTLIYGGSAVEDAPFRNLQQMYSGSSSHLRQVFLHTPEETQEYLVFAALPYSSIHILHYYDFRSERRYNSFFDSVFSTRALGMRLDENNRPEAGRDQVIILSTALRGDALQRYLVMAKRVHE